MNTGYRREQDALAKARLWGTGRQRQKTKEDVMQINYIGTWRQGKGTREHKSSPGQQIG
jgi:hypothetical protein